MILPFNLNETRECTTEAKNYHLLWKKPVKRKKAKKDDESPEMTVNELSERIHEINEQTGLYYHDTMKDYEKEMQEDEDKSKVFNTKEKSTLAEALFSNGRLSNFLYSTTILCDSSNNIPKSKRVSNHLQFVKYYSRMDFRFIFKELKNWELRKPYPCLMVAGNFAWISHDDEGIYRYYSKLSNGYTVGFSLFDLIQLREMIGVGTAIGQANARRVLVDLLKLPNYKEMEWEKSMINKINKNMIMIGRSQFDMVKYQPDLYKIVKPYLSVLEHVHIISLEFLSGDKDHSVKGQATFFASGNYITDFISVRTDKKKLQRDRITRMMNLFASLGLLNKVKEKDIPSELLKTATQYKEEHPEFNNVNFYTIPEYTPEVMKEANDRAVKLLDNKITEIKHVNEKSITKALGKVVAKSVYAIKSPLTDEQKVIKEKKAKTYHSKKAYYEKREAEIQAEAIQNNETDDLPF